MRPPLVVLAWAVLLGAIAAVQLVFTFDPTVLALGFGQAAFVALLAVMVLAARDEPPARRLPDLSLATVALTLGLTTMLIGAELGLWLILIGGGVAALGVGGLVRELRAERREERRS